MLLVASGCCARKARRCICIPPVSNSQLAARSVQQRASWDSPLDPGGGERWPTPPPLAPLIAPLVVSYTARIVYPCPLPAAHAARPAMASCALHVCCSLFSLPQVALLAQGAIDMRYELDT